MRYNYLLFFVLAAAIILLSSFSTSTTFGHIPCENEDEAHDNAIEAEKKAYAELRKAIFIMTTVTIS